MKEDKTIDQIRAVRHLISEEVGHDPAKLIEHYTQYQKKLKNRLISRPKQSIKVSESGEEHKAEDSK